MDFFEELNEYKTKIEGRKHLEAKLSELEYIKNQLYIKLPLLRERMKNEQEDVDKLNEYSFSALLSFISGKRKEKLNKEKQEALAAIMKYDAAMTQLNEVENKIIKTQNELRHIDRCEEKYNEMLKDLQKQMAQNSAHSEEILALEDEIAKINALIKEYDEAIDAGNKLLASAKSVYESLDASRDLELVETITNSAIVHMVTSSEQIEHIDYVVAMKKRMQVQINDFKAELADIGLEADLKIKINASLHILTYIDAIGFDFHMFDYTVKAKDVLDAITDIALILSVLNQELSTHVEKKNKLQSKINDIILKQQ